MISYNPWNNIPKFKNSKLIEYSINEKIFSDVESYLPRGLGRSYGDVCLNEGGSLILTNKINSIIDFDTINGTITCESGISINNLLKYISSSGWFLPVVPGTSYVTIGGAIANDIHGKNHHNVGSFGNNLISFTLLRSNGEILNCSLNENNEMFKATIGGLGLTGVILSAKIKLLKITSQFISAETIRYSSLTTFFEINKEKEINNEYTVSWIDFTSGNLNEIKGVFHSGNHTKQENLSELKFKKEISLSIPLQPPISLINNFTINILNSTYYLLNKNSSNKFQHYSKFFFPLDFIKNWNRAYGKNGFFQYQFVVPTESAENVIKKTIKEFKNFNQKPVLGVLKTFGNIEPLGILSFPRKGTTLAIDLQNKGKNTLELLNKLDEVIVDFGGRIYPAKDCRMSKFVFQKGYKEFQLFEKFIDPKFSSSFFNRIK